MVSALVAAKIAQFNPKKLMVFLVDNTALVEQQAKFFVNETNLSVISVSGSSGGSRKMMQMLKDLPQVTVFIKRFLITISSIVDRVYSGGYEKYHV